MSVAVVGAGSWGTTFASMTSDNTPTRLWCRSPEVAAEINARHTNAKYLPGFDLGAALQATADLGEAVESADVVVMAVPSHGFRATLEKVAPLVRPLVPVVSLTKGLEAGSLALMSEIVAEVLPGHPVGVLTGPNLAKEILAGQPAASVIGMADRQLALSLQSVFASGSYRVYTNVDVVGCGLGGALKNVVAIASGMAEGLGVGDNTRAAVITRGLAEITRLGEAMGADRRTFSGLAGLGDLVATCMSGQSRNRHVGEQLGRGRPIDDIVAERPTIAEGVRTSAAAAHLGSRHGVELPICEQVRRVIHEGASPEDAYEQLISRAPRTETEWF